MDMVESKWECKRILNKALKNGKFIKKEYEFVVKHILKCNLLLIKHYPLLKDSVNDMFESCNYLLSMGFFVNDKILILWIARSLNHIIKEEKVIYNELRLYLKYKDKDMKKTINKYFQKLSERSLIYNDDNCFEEYLPISTRGLYSEKYVEFEKEVRELNKNYVGLSKYQLNEDERNNIKEFEFCKIHEIQLLQEIKNIVVNYHENKGEFSYDGKINKILGMIWRFEGIDIRCNTNFEFYEFIVNIRYKKNNLYQLMKDGDFHYDIDDDFFVVDNDGKEVIEVNSVSDIMSLTYIDVPKWINYMQSHDIKTLDEMYFDKQYFQKLEMI